MKRSTSFILLYCDISSWPNSNAHKEELSQYSIYHSDYEFTVTIFSGDSDKFIGAFPISLLPIGPECTINVIDEPCPCPNCDYRDCGSKAVRGHSVVCAVDFAEGYRGLPCSIVEEKEHVEEDEEDEGWLWERPELEPMRFVIHAKYKNKHAHVFTFTYHCQGQQCKYKSHSYHHCTSDPPWNAVDESAEWACQTGVGDDGLINPEWAHIINGGESESNEGLLTYIKHEGEKEELLGDDGLGSVYMMTNLKFQIKMYTGRSDASICDSHSGHWERILASLEWAE